MIFYMCYLAFQRTDVFFLCIVSSLPIVPSPSFHFFFVALEQFHANKPNFSLSRAQKLVSCWGNSGWQNEGRHAGFCRFAEVTVRLKNVGRDAYKPEEYGDSIIIQRRLSVDGASTYRLRSERGAVVSTKREELLHILDQFNIQVRCYPCFH